MQPEASTLNVEEQGQTPTDRDTAEGPVLPNRDPASLAMVMELYIDCVYDLITQKFCEGASIEEIVRVAGDSLIHNL